MNLYSPLEKKGEKVEALEEAETLLTTGRQAEHHFCSHCGRPCAQQDRRDRAGVFASLACLFLVAVVSLVLVTTRLFTRVVVDPSLQLYCRYPRLTTTFQLAIGFTSLCIILLTTLCLPNSLSIAPANHLVEYIPVKFNRSRGEDKTPFQGWPNDEIDRTWTESYQGSHFLLLLPRYVAVSGNQD